MVWLCTDISEMPRVIPLVHEAFHVFHMHRYGLDWDSTRDSPVRKNEISLPIICGASTSPPINQHMAVRKIFPGMSYPWMENDQINKLLLPTLIRP